MPMSCTICRRALDPEREQIRHQRCADRLRTNLIELPGLYALMGTVLAPGTAGGRSRVSGTRTAPLPVRLEPLSLRARGGIITILATWEVDWRDLRGLTDAQRGTSERDLSAIVLWLRAHLPWAIENHLAIDEFAMEVRDIVRQCRSAAGLLPSMMRIGACPALDGETACGAALYADPVADEIRCRCGARWTRPQWMVLGKAMRGEEERPPKSDLVRFKVSEGSIDLQGAEVSAEVMELLVVANETQDWDERLSA